MWLYVVFKHSGRSPKPGRLSPFLPRTASAFKSLKHKRAIGIFMSTPPAPPVAIGDILSVAIDTAGPHGQGIAHLDNFIIFVENIAVGVKAKVKITHLGRTYANAKRVG